MDNLPPVLSVIVPVYKSEDTIERALDSVPPACGSLPFEVLLAFDGGEKTKEILLGYCARHPNFRLFVHKERLGPGKGRMEAIKEAKGEYLAFLDSDDYFLPSALERMHSVAKLHNADVVNCSFKIDMGAPDLLSNSFTRNKAFEGEKSILNAFFSDSFFRSFLPNKLLRRELFDGSFLLFGEKGDLFEDRALLGSLLARAKKMVSIKDALYVYNKSNPSSVTTLKRTDRHCRSLSVFLALKAFYERNNDAIALSSFRAKRWRIRLSLHFDLALDRKNGLSRKEARLQRKKEKALFGKGLSADYLPDGSSFVDRLSSLTD